ISPNLASTASSTPSLHDALPICPVLDEDTGPFRHIVYALGNTLFGLHGFPDLHSKDAFNEHTPGLDHVSFGCASRAELVQAGRRSEEHTSELQSRVDLVCRLLLE